MAGEEFESVDQWSPPNLQLTRQRKKYFFRKQFSSVSPNLSLYLIYLIGQTFVCMFSH